MLIPLTAVAIGISELLLPIIFPNNPYDVVEIGRWFLLTIALVVALELNYGLMLGVHDFFAYNVLRLAQPALMAAAFVVLWPLDALTVTTALIAAGGRHRAGPGGRHVAVGRADRSPGARLRGSACTRSGSACAGRGPRWRTT